MISRLLTKFRSIINIQMVVDTYRLESLVQLFRYIHMGVFKRKSCDIRLTSHHFCLHCITHTKLCSHQRCMFSRPSCFHPLRRSSVPSVQHLLESTFYQFTIQKTLVKKKTFKSLLKQRLVYFPSLRAYLFLYILHKCNQTIHEHSCMDSFLGLMFIMFISFIHGHGRVDRTCIKILVVLTIRQTCSKDPQTMNAKSY